jgi:hypothetical protein
MLMMMIIIMSHIIVVVIPGLPHESAGNPLRPSSVLERSLFLEIRTHFIISWQSFCLIQSALPFAITYSVRH